MKKIIIVSAAAFGLTMGLYAALTSPVEKMPCPKCYVMHPEVLPLDSSGNRTYDVKRISQERTCGECHNTAFINGHNSHYNDNVRIGCSECHVEGGVLSTARENINPDGTLKKERIKIRVPSDENCLRCHGVGGIKEKTVSIPDNFPGSIIEYQGNSCFRVTCRTGEILSPENISDSLINIKGRDSLRYPWDVHLQREVACVSCHFTRNDPRRAETRASDQAYLANDPRKSYSIGKYLYIPDHKLVHADCRSCHKPEEKHDFLPYKKRHFAVLSCQSCHVTRLYGPALKSVDETVVSSGGSPRYEYRSGYSTDGGNLNTAYTYGYEPFLVSHDEDKQSGGEITGIKNGISPVNIILRWRWKDQEGRDVPYNTVKSAYMNGKEYRPDIIRVFDADSDGRLDDKELIIDSSAKFEAVKSGLAMAGVKNPVISGGYEIYRVSHGIAHEKSMKEDCYSCHSGNSRFDAEVELASRTPYGSRLPDNGSVMMNGLGFYLNGILRKEGTGLSLEKDGDVDKRYIFGYSSITWLNVIGFLIFLLSVAGAAAHGVLRNIAGRDLPAHEARLVQHNIYPLYERIWHWGMALSVIMLILTGLEIHYAGTFTLFGFDTTVDIHNAFALIVTVNAGLSLFYHAATGEIKQYFRITKGFRGDLVVQSVYYLYGIFKGSGHPFERSHERKLNPLQQLTYVMLLNVLFPVQILTGIMMWLVSVWPAFSATAGGLTVIAPVHNFCAWLFISFLTIHLYLITTGHTVTGSLKAMWTGTEEIDESESADSSRDRLAGIGLTEIVNNIKKLARRGREEK